MAMTQLTQTELKGLFHYNPETGIFIRLTNQAPIARKGGIAGTKTKAGYIRISINYKKYFAHRLAWLYMTGAWPANEIDHENHIKDDNRWDNIRDETHAENMKNQSIGKNNSSGIAGVSWFQKLKAWRANIGINGKDKCLIQSKDFFEACCVRKSAENKHGFHENHGTFISIK